MTSLVLTRAKGKTHGSDLYRLMASCQPYATLSRFNGPMRYLLRKRDIRRVGKGRKYLKIIYENLERRNIPGVLCHADQALKSMDKLRSIKNTVCIYSHDNE